MNSPTAPAGWYPDPQDPSQMRWWDGSQWGETQSPPPPSAVSATPPAALTPPSSTTPPASASGQGGGYRQFTRQPWVRALRVVLAVLGVILMTADHNFAAGAVLMGASIALGGRWFFFMW